jgi:hypothetical protein
MMVIWANQNWEHDVNCNGEMTFSWVFLFFAIVVIYKPKYGKIIGKAPI